MFDKIYSTPLELPQSQDTLTMDFNEGKRTQNTSHSEDFSNISWSLEREVNALQLVENAHMNIGSLKSLNYRNWARSQIDENRDNFYKKIGS